MNIHLPDFDVKKLVKEAGSNLGNTFSRVVQLTEEKFGHAEKTELDSHFENLAERAECTKVWTEKIVRDTESVLIPNPGNRVEDFIFEKIEKKKPQRLSNMEYLGLDMIEAGGDFGQDTAYGQALIKVGQAEQKLGVCERDFIGSVGICFTQPLKKFLEGEMKTITKEKGILETKRLDLDACKNRVRKARSMIGQQAAERDLRVAQAEFDRQAEITKILLEGISTSQAGHLRHLHSFVETQVRYYNQCISIMNDLQKELVRLGGPTPYEPVGLDDDKNDSKTRSPEMGSEMKRARVLCSYDAKDHTELSLSSNEVILVTECSPMNSDYVYGKQGLLKGLVPRAFLEILDDNEE
ncbi:endophilin-B1 isoform X2 [Condylostylus longicornis]|uniref:endophilin-B1 isoform X2 n=1 Tax=Condylostylus longicornis TaxID=2530218 RepID=UPI00244DA2CD|nr:endophilin-B1 isoform X2 [Condylostylus longicornis]